MATTFTPRHQKRLPAIRKMSSSFTRTNRKRLTNISMVRLKKAGKRFEIACYPNKVTSWRNQVVTDIGEVLQMQTVFTNVSKGQLAKAEDLLAAFGTDKQAEVCLQILSKGELQVSEKERSANIESMFRDIAMIVSEKCINVMTNRPFPVTVIERTMKDVHFSMKPKRNTRKQALEAIKLLKENSRLRIRAFYNQRMYMRLKISIPAKDGKKVRENIKKLAIKVEEEDFSGDLEMVFLMDSGYYFEIRDQVQSDTKGKGRLEVMKYIST